MSGTMTTSIRERSTREWMRRLLVGVVLFGVQFGLLALVVMLSEDTFYALSTSYASTSSDPMDAFVTGIIITNGLIWILVIYNILRLIWSLRPAMTIAVVLLAALLMAYVVQWEPAGIMLCVLGGLAWVVPVLVERLIAKRIEARRARSLPV